MAKIVKKGRAIPFSCASCECEFIIGIRSLSRMLDGNFYAVCPTCGSECHTDVAKIKDYIKNNWEVGATCDVK